MIEQSQEQQKKFRVKIQTQFLSSVCRNIKDLTTEIRLNFTEEGLRVLEVEPANICMIDISISKNNFMAYEINESVSLGVNVDSLYNACKEQKKTEVTISTANNKLLLSFSSGFNSELSLIDIEGEKKELPILEHQTFITLHSKKFKEIVKNLSSISDSLIIEVKDNKVKFLGESGINKSEIVLNDDDVLISGLPAKSKYSLEYLNKFIKDMISEKVILKLNNDYPIIVSYEAGTFKLNYILAPRVDTE